MHAPTSATNSGSSVHALPAHTCPGTGGKTIEYAQSMRHFTPSHGGAHALPHGLLSEPQAAGIACKCRQANHPPSKDAPAKRDVMQHLLASSLVECKR